MYYDEVDKVPGCPDVVTFNPVAEAGISSESATEINAGSGDTTREISTSSSPSVPETPAERRQASKKRKRAAKRKAPGNESYDEALKDVRQQREKVATFLDSLQQTNTQRLAVMGHFVGSIVKILDKEQNEK